MDGPAKSCTADGCDAGSIPSTVGVPMAVSPYCLELQPLNLSCYFHFIFDTFLLIPTLSHGFVMLCHALQMLPLPSFVEV